MVPPLQKEEEKGEEEKAMSRREVYGFWCFEGREGRLFVRAGT